MANAAKKRAPEWVKLTACLLMLIAVIGLVLSLGIKNPLGIKTHAVELDS